MALRLRFMGVALSALLSALLSAMGLAGIAMSADNASVVERDGKPDIALTAADDAPMRAAIAQARTSVEEFIAAFGKPAARQRSFAVIVAVIDGKLIEQLWVDVESYADGQFTGRIANDPYQVSNVHRGDRIVVDKERISDWMFVDRGHLVGGFIIRALRARLTADERARFDSTLPFVITD
jgi:uncharacterized protein YegJ (DUF2314 family)